MKRNILAKIETSLLDMVQAFEWLVPEAADFALAAYADVGALSDDSMMKCLSRDEQDMANRRPTADERRHFILRRCFQRLFVACVTSWPEHPCRLALSHQTDHPPQLVDQPDLNLSFSSSGSFVLACASRQRRMGVDVERLRLIPNAVALAQRFFSAPEAEALQALPESQQSYQFLLQWTAKEAALKSIGQGIDSGLNSFIFQNGPKGPLLNPNLGVERPLDVSLQHIDFKNLYLIAVVANKAVEKRWLS